MGLVRKKKITSLEFKFLLDTVTGTGSLASENPCGSLQSCAGPPKTFEEIPAEAS